MLTATGNPAPILTFTNLPNGFTALGWRSAAHSHARTISSICTPQTSQAPMTKLLYSQSRASGAGHHQPCRSTARLASISTMRSPPPASRAHAHLRQSPRWNHRQRSVLSGKFTTSGQFSIGLHATNSQGSDNKTLIVNVSPADVAPNITSSPRCSSSPSRRLFTISPQPERRPSRTRLTTFPGNHGQRLFADGYFHHARRFQHRPARHEQYRRRRQNADRHCINAPVGPHITSRSPQPRSWASISSTRSPPPAIRSSPTARRCRRSTLSGATISGIFTAP